MKFGIWGFLLMIFHLTSKMEKMSCRLRNDDIIDLQTIIKIQLHIISAMICLSETRYFRDLP